jgi:endonuclease III related protein
LMSARLRPSVHLMEGVSLETRAAGVVQNEVGTTMLAIYDRLLCYYGPQGWWPTRTGSRWEVMLGAVLTQHTSWTNVERALDKMAAAWGEDGLARPDRVSEAPEEELARLIAPAGFYKSKTDTLRVLAQYIVGKGGPERLAVSPQSDLEVRNELLALRGIGPETADAILLYALGRPIFVADAYALRLAVRWGLLAPSARYAQVQALFMANLAHDAALFNEYHALIVAHAKRICRPHAMCEICPLAARLPWEIEPNGQVWICPRLHTGRGNKEEGT